MFTTLLVPLDRSSLAEEALGPAAALARAAKATVDLVLVHEPDLFTGGRDAPWIPSHLDDDERYLTSIGTELQTGAGVSATHIVLQGRAADQICARATEMGAGMIVMTSHGRTGVNRAWLGSVADDVVRRSHVPVLMLRPAAHSESGAPIPPHNISRVLVPIDGSALSMEILEPAMALARCTDATVVLLQVVPPASMVVPDLTVPLMYPPTILDESATGFFAEEATRLLASIARGMSDRGVNSVELHVLVALGAAETIIGFAATNDIDAIAMSTHGRGVSRLVVGSVSDKVRRACDVPVLLYRPPAVAERGAAGEADRILQQLPLMTAV